MILDSDYDITYRQKAFNPYNRTGSIIGPTGYMKKRFRKEDVACRVHEVEEETIRNNSDDTDDIDTMIVYILILYSTTAAHTTELI